VAVPAGGGSGLLALRLRDARATRAFGRRLGESARPGDVLDLRGALGSGKTTLAQGVLRALVGPGAYRSPSFDLVHVYGGRVYHADLDRVDASEWEEIGAEEWVEQAAIAILEHGERVPGRLPEDRLEVHLARGATRRRRVAGVRPRGPRARAWLARALGRSRAR
jgi:tRNA threonylcarbamoyl adenosine modification protein YjeE